MNAEGLPPLTDMPGDPLNGKQVVMDRQLGDCIVCHAMPLPKRQFHGTLGPPLDTVGSRYTAALLRLRIVNPKALNPGSIMPSYHRVEGLHRVQSALQNQPVLSAQEVEDVVAYLLTLTQEKTQ